MRRRRRRRRVSLVRQIAAVAAVLVVIYAVLPLLLSARRMQPIAEETLSRNLGRRVRIGSLRFSATFGSLIATDVTVADDPVFSSAPFVYAQSVELSVRRIPLIFRRSIELTGVTLIEPTITLIHNAAEWNFYALLAAGPQPGDTAPGPSVRVVRGILVVRASDHYDPFVLRDISFEAQRFSTAIENAFKLSATVAGGGELKLSGNWGPVIWKGRVPSAPMHVLANARKIAVAESNLMAGMAPAVGGVLSLDGTIESDAVSLQMKGAGGLDKLKLSAEGTPTIEPLNFDYALGYDFGAGAGTVPRISLTLPKGSAELSGKYFMGDNGAIVNLAVQVQGAPVTQLAGLLPSSGVPLPPGAGLQAGVAFAQLSIEGALKAPTVTGVLTLNNTKLTGFNLEERLSGVEGLDLLHIDRDLGIDALRSKVQMGPEKVVLTEIEVDLPQVGIIAGQGVIDANRTLDFQMSAVRHGTSDKRAIPFVVRGPCIAPIFRPPGKI